MIEETLQRLKPPAWPEDLLGAVDKPLAAKGRALFAENCAGCHVPRPNPGRRARVQHLHMLPVDVIGTDPNAANNIANHRFDLTALQWDPAELEQTGRQTASSAQRTIGPEPAVGGQGPGLRHRFRRQPRLSRSRRHAGRATADMDGFGLPIGVREKVRLQGAPIGGRMGDRRRSCTTVRCRAFINCFHRRMNAPPPSIKAPSNTTRGTWAIAPKPLTMVSCSTRASPAITTAATNSAPASAATA